MRTLPAVLCAVIFAIGAPSSLAGFAFVEDVRQNFDEKVNSAAIQQIHSFNKNALFYDAYASYFSRADVDLPGFQNYFAGRAVESRELAQNLTTAVNKRGGFIFFQKIKLRLLCHSLRGSLRRFPRVCYFVLENPPKQKKFTSKKNKKRKSLNYKKPFLSNKYTQKTSSSRPNALDALEDSLALARQTNAGILSLMDIALMKNDPGMRPTIDDLLERQAEAIHTVASFVTRLKSYQGTDSYTLGEYVLDSEITY